MNENNRYYFTDIATACLVALLTFCTRFLNWYGFYIAEEEHGTLFNSFGPYGPVGFDDGKELGLDTISGLLVVSKVLLTISAVLFFVYLASICVSRLRTSIVSFISGLLFFGTTLASAVLGFFGAVGNSDAVYGVDATIGIGWYAALALSLLGLALTAAPKLVSNLLESYRHN